MPDLFGTPAGSMAANKETQDIQLSNLAMATESVKLRQAQMTLAAQERMSAMLANQATKGQPFGGPTNSEGMSSELYNLADMYVRSGLPSEGAKLARTASTLERNSSTINKNMLETTQKKLTAYAGLLDGVKDQQSWQRANATFMMMYGEQPKWANRPYDPKVVEALRAGALTSLQRLKVKSEIITQQERAAQARHADASATLAKAQTKIAEQRLKDMGKEGVKPPKGSTISAMANMITEKYGDQAAAPSGTAHVKVLAEGLAEEAENLMRTQGIPMSEASRRVFMDADARGDFSGMRPNKTGRGSQAMPLAIPVADGKLDKGKLVDNNWYTVNGQPRMYMEGQFYTADELKELRQDGESPEGDESDETDKEEEP